MRMLLVRSTQDLSLVRPGGAHQPFIVHTGDHVLKLSVTISVPHLRINWFKARRQDDRPNMDVHPLRCLIEIDGLILTDRFANTTFLLFKVKAAFVDVGDQGNGLSKVDMDSFILRDFLIELIRVFDRAVFNAGRTTPAFVLYNISGLLQQGDLELSCFSFYSVHFSVGQNLYIGMPADLDQFGCKDSDGAVVGGKGLVKLGHMAANGRGLVDQVNLKTRTGKIKRGLNTADPSADNHHVSKMAACETFSNTVCETFTDLVFNVSQLFLHLLSPRWVSLEQPVKSLPGESP